MVFLGSKLASELSESDVSLDAEIALKNERIPVIFQQIIGLKPWTFIQHSCNYMM